MSNAARYTEGPVFRHVSEAALTSAVGLFAIFIVDLVDMFFISLLGEPALAAAIGFAGILLFLGASICIGVSVAVSTVVSQAIGEGNQNSADSSASDSENNKYPERASRMAIHGLIFSLLLTLPVTALTLWFAPEILAVIGAEGDVLDLSVGYFRIVGASLPVLGVAFVCNGLLRSVGAAKMSMWSTLWGGIVNGVLDPVFIFLLGLGLPGAAVASVISRFTVAGVAFYNLQRNHGLLKRAEPAMFLTDLRELLSLAFPSILTNLSAPVSSAFATAQMARYGTEAVAAASVIGRIAPVLFAGLYGLSGAVGPIASQNYGATNYHRVHETLRASARFVIIYVLPLVVIMFFAHRYVAQVFSLNEEAADLLKFYATFIVGSYALFGLQLSANPMFTALRHPGYATVSNITRDLLLAVPLMAGFSSLFGAAGVLAGQALANSIAGVLAFTCAWWLTRRVEEGKSIDLSWSSVHLNHHFHVMPGANHRGH